MAGLTPIERAVMALWDQGFSMQRVARTLEIEFDRVRRIVSYYHGGEERRTHRAAMIHGSRSLAAAIRRERAI